MEASLIVDREDDEVSGVPVRDEKVATGRVDPHRSWRLAQARLEADQVDTPGVIDVKDRHAVASSVADKERAPIGMEVNLGAGISAFVAGRTRRARPSRPRVRDGPLCARGRAVPSDRTGR